MRSKVYVIIPARKGSKRIPGKNLAKLNGIPLIMYSIEYAKRHKNIDDIYVSTDSIEISNLAIKNGVNTLDRPAELAGDMILTQDVISFHLNKEKIFEKNDIIIVLQPTSPFRNKHLLKNSLKLFELNKIDSLCTFSPLRKKYGSIKNNKFNPINYSFGQRSQDIVPDYYENGLLYISTVDCIMNKGMLNKNTYALITDDNESTVDIDEIEDLDFAEFLIKMRKV